MTAKIIDSQGNLFFGDLVARPRMRHDEIVATNSPLITYYGPRVNGVAPHANGERKIAARFRFSENDELDGVWIEPEAVIWATRGRPTQDS